MHGASALFRLLADPTRLRLLRVLARDRFNVSELTGILALAQSGVSRHLGLLKEAGLVLEEREAGYVYYRVPPSGARGGRRTALDTAGRAVRHRRCRPRGAGGRGAPAGGAAASQGELRHAPAMPGSSCPAGAGRPGRAPSATCCRRSTSPTSAAATAISPSKSPHWAGTVTGIDRSDDVLERAKSLATRRQVGNIAWKKGELTRLPLRDGSVDVALLSQSLQYASDPERALAEAARVLRPGGRVLVLDLKEHDQDWVRARFGNQRLGFARERARGAASRRRAEGHPRHHRGA